VCNNREFHAAAFDIDRVVDRINEVAARARTAGAPVFLIQHEEDDGPLRFSAAGWQLYERPAVRPEDIRVRKTATDSFHKTELQALLQSLGIIRLVVCGLQSEFCVDSTVRGALALGYPVVLVSDAHSTIDNGVPISGANLGPSRRYLGQHWKLWAKSHHHLCLCRRPAH
jgi:nicotinamidase-related amidase